MTLLITSSNLTLTSVSPRSTGDVVVDVFQASTMGPSVDRSCIIAVVLRKMVPHLVFARKRFNTGTIRDRTPDGDGVQVVQRVVMAYKVSSGIKRLIAFSMIADELVLIPSSSRFIGSALKVEEDYAQPCLRRLGGACNVCLV